MRTVGKPDPDHLPGAQRGVRDLPLLQLPVHPEHGHADQLHGGQRGLRGPDPAPGPPAGLQTPEEGERGALTTVRAGSGNVASSIGKLFLDLQS